MKRRCSRGSVGRVCPPSLWPQSLTRFPPHNSHQIRFAAASPQPSVTRSLSVSLSPEAFKLNSLFAAVSSLSFTLPAAIHSAPFSIFTLISETPWLSVLSLSLPVHPRSTSHLSTLIVSLPKSTLCCSNEARDWTDAKVYNPVSSTPQTEQQFEGLITGSDVRFYPRYHFSIILLHFRVQ